MSANNELTITKRGEIYDVSEIDVDTGSGFLVMQCASLEEAIREANKYQEENEVEYGLNIKIPAKKEPPMRKCCGEKESPQIDIGHFKHCVCGLPGCPSLSLNPPSEPKTNQMKYCTCSDFVNYGKCENTEYNSEPKTNWEERFESLWWDKKLDLPVRHKQANKKFIKDLISSQREEAYELGRKDLLQECPDTQFLIDKAKSQLLSDLEKWAEKELLVGELASLNVFLDSLK